LKINVWKSDFTLKEDKWTKKMRKDLGILGKTKEQLSGIFFMP
jgi:hypothetical protein